MPTTLFDKSGKQVQVDDKDLTQALVSGQYGTTKDTVAVQSPTGEIAHVPVANLAQFSKTVNGQLTVLSDDALAKAQQQKTQAAKEEKYGGLGYQALAAGSSALGSATLGVSDVALGAVLSDEQKRTLETAKEVNPGSTIGGGIVGALLPTLLTGGTAAPEEAAMLAARGGEAALVRGGEALAERGLARTVLGGARDAFTAPTRALNAISGGTERGLASLMGEAGEQTVGAAMKRAIARGGGDAVAGAAATGATELGENAVSSDHSLTGEQLVQHMAFGGLLGAGVGSLSSVLGDAGSAVLGKLATREEGEEVGGLRGALMKRAEQMQFKASGARTPEIRRLNAHGIETEEAGRWMLDELPKFTADGGSPISHEAIGEAAERARAEAGGKIGANIEALDMLGAKVDAAPIVQRLRAEVVDPLSKKIGQSAAADKLFNLAQQVEERLIANPTFGELQKARIELDELAWKGRKALDESNVTKEIRSASSIMENELRSQGEKTAGAHWAEEYDANKYQYKMAKNVVDAVNAADQRIAGNNVIGLRDTIIGAHAAPHVLGAAKHLAMGALGIGAASEAGEGNGGAALAMGSALAMAYGHHLLTHYGDAVGSRIIDRLAGSRVGAPGFRSLTSGAVVRSAQMRYSTAVTRGIDTALGQGRALAGTKKRSVDSEFDANTKSVKAVLQDPQGWMHNVTTQAEQLGPQFATVASVYTKTALSTATYLAQQMPRATPIDPLQPKAGKKDPTHAEKARFNAIWRAVNDPPSILHDMAKGTMTSDQLKALQSTQPSSLADIQKRMTAAVAQSTKPLTPTQKANINMLLGKPALDHPPPPAPPEQNEQPKKATSRPLKIDFGQSVGLVGSRSRTA